MTIEEYVKIAVDAAEEKKSEDTVILNIGKVSVIADYFVITTANNISQLQAVVDNVDEKLTKAGLQAKCIEGKGDSNWILMDYGDFIVHVFDREGRSFYDLERIWKDADELNVNDFYKSDRV